ncbi:hypothetical protein [Sporocytophaga myxococcoides]|uniref:hypothetical protein n=1 Tax=Sporocytophaga myxococcoides TaxID=153721 RepID=UPI0004127515|nr:hypothetical protein [Sporocytophaga myxococcoides]
MESEEINNAKPSKEMYYALPIAYEIVVSITNKTTSPITLNNIDPLPCTSGNPVAMSGFNTSAGTTGNGFIIFQGETVEVFRACGGWNSDTGDAPNTQGTIVYNTSDSLLTITWDIGEDNTILRPVFNSVSQYEAIDSAPVLSTRYRNYGSGEYQVNLSTYTIVVQPKN